MFPERTEAADSREDFNGIARDSRLLDTCRF